MARSGTLTAEFDTGRANIHCDVVPEKGKKVFEAIGPSIELILEALRGVDRDVAMRALNSNEGKEFERWLEEGRGFEAAFEDWKSALDQGKFA